MNIVKKSVVATALVAAAIVAFSPPVRPSTTISQNRSDEDLLNGLAEDVDDLLGDKSDLLGGLR